MAATDLRRVYAFSDTYGRSKNPFIQDDADAIISTDFRSFPCEKVFRQFDIYGREAVTGHMVRMIFQLQKNALQSEYFCKKVQDDFANTVTGIFINAAPRLNKEQNGAPFYVAVSGNIRIVTTDLSCLSAVKEQIETLHYLPNENNRIYSNTEQFRSSYTPHLLYPDHGQELAEAKIDVIPDYPENKWELAYVDRFGNLVTYTKYPDRKWKEVEDALRKDGETAKVIIGNVSQRLIITTSLKDAEPGELVIYKNGDIDILRKWEADEDQYTRLYKSAYFQFAKPEIGMEIKIPKKTVVD